MKVNYKLISGVSLILMAVLAMLATGLHNQSIVRTLSLIAIIILDFIVSWGLYHIFKEVNQQQSTLAAFLRMVYTLILTVAVIQLINDNSWGSFSSQESFTTSWSWGLIVFGFHLISIGYLSIRSRLIPNWLSFVIIIGGVGYVIVHSMSSFHIAGHQIVEYIFMAPMIIGELGLAVILLMKTNLKSKR